MSTLPLIAPKKKERYLYIFALSITLLVATLLTIIFAKEALSIYRAKNWVEVSCFINDINVINKRGPTKVKIEYQYFFDKKRYLGTRYDFGDESKIPLAVPNGLYDIKIGSINHCYVNPNNPTESVFSKKIDRFKIIEFIHAIGSILVFLYLFRTLTTRTPQNNNTVEASPN